MNVISDGIKHTWSAFIFLLLDLFTPNGVKRLILLSTVFVYLSRKGILMEETDSKLKEYVNSQTGCNVYDFANRFANAIWDNTTLKQQVDVKINRPVHKDEVCVTNTSAIDISAAIVKASPDWLLYRPDQCQADLVGILENRPLVLN